MWAGAFRRQAERAPARLGPGARSARQGGLSHCTADRAREQTVRTPFSALSRFVRPAPVSRARKPRRLRLGVEYLERRDVPAALSVSDVTVREGPTATGIRDPAGAASVGINGVRNIAFDNGPNDSHY